MKAIVVKMMGLIGMMLFYSMMCFSQQVITVSQALKNIGYSNPPYQNTKFVPFPTLELFPPIVEGISDNLYEDMQCTKFIHASGNEDLEPSLYLKFKLPNSANILGALTFGGATDYEVDRLFISDEVGNIKSSMDVSVSLSGIYVKQYRITTDYKIIVYQMIPTSTSIVMFGDLIGKDSKTIQCYRMDTTYYIEENGQIVKECDRKYSVKTYTTKQLVDKNIWDL